MLFDKGEIMKDRKRWVYAMYKGDELLAIGTTREICEKMQIKEKTFHYYRTKTYERRLKNRKEMNARRIIIVDKEV